MSLYKAATALFYILGITFVVAELLRRLQIGGMLPSYYMRVADVPLYIAAIIYGCGSFYRSITSQRSLLLGFIINIVVLFFIAIVLYLNYFSLIAPFISV
jgi:hypothetical protein